MFASVWVAAMAVGQYEPSPVKWLLRQAVAVLLVSLALRLAVAIVAPVVPFLTLGGLVLVSAYWFVRTR